MQGLRKFNIETVAPGSQDRATAEAEALAGVAGDGRRRLKSGRNNQTIFRMTDQRRMQLERLADALSSGRERQVSFTETMERALDALEAQLKGPKK